MKELSIIIPYKNEGREPYHTINSIYNSLCCGKADKIEIVLINDNSNDDVAAEILNVYKGIKYIKSPINLGSAKAKALGLSISTSPNVLILDAHMRFKNDDWYTKILKSIEQDSKCVYCTTSLGLNETNRNIGRPDGKYYGCRLLLQEEENNNRNVLIGKWQDKKGEGTYEIPCVMGANYYGSREWFKYIGAYDGLKGWGAEEEYMSISSWLAGGTCKINTDIEIGHIYRSTNPNPISQYNIMYNRLYTAYTMLDNDLFKYILKFLGSTEIVNFAFKELLDNLEYVDNKKKYFEGIRKTTFKEYYDKFNKQI